MEKMRNIFLFAAVLLICGAIAFFCYSKPIEEEAEAEAEVEYYNPFQDECDSIMGYPTSWLGAYIVDLKTGKPLYSKNADSLFRPASTTKMLTAACVLVDNDSNQCFKTKVDISGEIVNNALNGDLIVVSSTDPLLGTQSYKKINGAEFIDSIVAKIKSLGISQIAGAIRVDASQYKEWGVPKGWQGNDTVSTYGTPYRSFNYRSNLVYNKKQKAERVNYAPDSLLIQDLKHALADKGIYVLNNLDKPTENKRTTIYTHNSLRFADMLALMTKYSDNLVAEGFLRALSPKAEQREDALSKERRILRKLDVPMPDSLAVFDGSGLSRLTKLSPKYLAALLTAMAKTKYAKTYLRLPPRVGIEGTVHSLLKNTPLAGRLRLKTGSLNDVQCYAGYAFMDDNAPTTPTHVIVIYGNFFPMTRAEFVKKVSNMLLHIFEQ